MFLLLFVCFIPVFPFFICPFASLREKEGLELGRWGGEEDLEGDVRGETMIGIYRIKVTLFSIKKFKINTNILFFQVRIK